MGRSLLYSFCALGKYDIERAVALIGTNAEVSGMINHQFPPLLSLSTRSKSALDFLIEKFQHCCKNHLGCGLQNSPMATYPSRIIDVGSSEDTVYLCDTEILVERGSYICLSHCWGQKQPFMLTKETVSILKKGVLVSALPKTFQDAIFVTRLLKTRFLWIDSLCVYRYHGLVTHAYIE
jgi:hypothetical protein